MAGASNEKRPRTEDNQERSNISQTPESEGESVSPRSPVGKKAKTKPCQNSNAEWVKKIQTTKLVKSGKINQISYYLGSSFLCHVY